MKRYKVFMSVEFELLAPSISVVVNDANEISDNMNVDKKMINICVQEKDSMEDMTSVFVQSKSTELPPVGNNIDYDRIPDTDER